MPAQRYSEKRLQDPFTVSLLFSEPFQFRLPDVIAAITEEFPALGEWSDFWGDQVFDTAHGAMGMLPRKGFPNGGSVSFHAMPPGPLPEYETAISRAFAFPGARDAWKAHTSHLTFSYNSEGRDLASRFKAARLVTCVSAVLAADPTCVGVSFPAAMSSPRQTTGGRARPRPS